MNRRSFLTSILALSAAPAIVRADSLMRIVPREALVLSVSEQTPVTAGITGDICMWVRFTYNAATGLPAFYDSFDGEKWNTLPVQAVKNDAGISSFHAHSDLLGEPLTTFPREAKETDIRFHVRKPEKFVTGILTPTWSVVTK